MVGGREIDLRKKEFDLLYILISKKEKVLQKSFLTETVWGYDDFSTTHTLQEHMMRLRKKLGREGSKIKTIRNVGYKFTEE